MARDKKLSSLPHLNWLNFTGKHRPGNECNKGYAWVSNPAGAILVNGERLPASLSRTDDWTLMSAPSENPPAGFGIRSHVRNRALTLVVFRRSQPLSYSRPFLGTGSFFHPVVIPRIFH
jgi:hypothetical protein